MEYEWHINSFSSLRHKCLSDAFEALSFKWKVIMYPLGNGDAALDQLSLFLGVADAKKLPPGWSKLARFRLQIVNHINPAKTISKEVTHKFNTTNSDYGWRSFVDLSTLHDPQAGFIKNDLVVIKASVTEVDRKAEAAAQAKAVTKQKTPKEDHAKARTYPKCLRRDDGHDNPHDAMIEILYHIASFRKIVLSRPYGSNTVITTLQRIFYQMHQGSQPIANLVTSKSNLYETDWLLSSLLSNLSPPLEHSGKGLFLEPAHIVCEMTPNNVLEGLKRHFSHKPILVDNCILPSIIRAYITAKSIPQDKKSVFPLTLPLSKFAPLKDHEHTLYYLFAIEVGEGNDHFYSYIKPFGNNNWFKIDGDPVETKVQINNTHSTITFYGEVHDRPPNCIKIDLLFYVKDTDVTNVLADVHASQYSAALKKGMRDLVEEYDPYILLKVYVDEDFTSFFGLVNEDVLVKEFEVKCTKTLKEFKSVIQSEFGISVDHQLFWIMEAEDDGQKRPQRAIPPVDEEFPLGDLAETSVVLELYLQDLKTISPAVACKEMLLFLKFYDPATLTLRYYGSAVFKGKMKVGQVADSIHQIMGNPAGTKLWLYEEVSPECITLLHPDSTLNEAELCTGGIIIFQRSVSSEARRGLTYPTAPDFCDWILNRVHISLRPLDDVYSPGIAIEVHKNTPYDNLASQVSRLLDIPAHKLVFFVFKYESSVTQISIPLSRELYPSVMADLGTYRYSIYYLEQKPAPAELRDHTLAMRVWWYDYYNTPVKEHCFELEADASVANVLQYIQSSVKLDPEHGTGRVRLMVLSNSHIMHVFEEDEKLSNFAYPPLSYLRAEEESKEEVNTEKGVTKLVEVMQIFYSEGMVMAGNDPFLLCIRTEELFGKVKERVQKRLKISDEDFRRSRVIMHNNAGKPVHITDGHAFSEEELAEYKYLAIYSAKPKHNKHFNNNNNNNEPHIISKGDASFSVGNTNIIANISEAEGKKQQRHKIAATIKGKQNGTTHNENNTTSSNNTNNTNNTHITPTNDTKHNNTDTKHEKDKHETVNTTEHNTTNTSTTTTDTTNTNTPNSTNTKNTTKEEEEGTSGIPDEVEDVIGKRLTRNVVNEFFWKKKNEEVLQKVKEEEERTRSQQKEQMQKRMAEVEKFAKLREERLQKQLEDSVKKEDRRRFEEIEIDDIEHEIEEIRRRDKQMEEERKGIERDIMTDEELIRKELENRKREIEIMTNFINMKNNANKWIEDAKMSLNSDTTAPPKASAPSQEKSNKKKNHGIEKIERYFKEIKYEDIKVGVPKTVLGHGGSSKVIKATYLGQEVAVKKFHGNFDSILPKVRMEIALLSELRHPHVILLIGACTEPSKPLCVVTEYMLNGSLFDVIHVRRVNLPLYMKLSIAKDIARGLNFLHKSNPICIHRDLNSKNILLDEYFRAKLADFGISRLVSSTTPAMTCHTGSSEWSAPELLLGDDYAHKVDSYSFAVILWELFTGQVPYGTLGLSPLQIGLRVLTKGLRPSPLPSLDTCPPLILELIVKCWDRDPNKRWEFDAILECLNAVIIDPSPVVSLSNTPYDKVKPGKADECKICFTSKINTCLVPCGHLCVCSECAEVITRDNKGGTCPICRNRIQKVVVTYQS